MGTSMVQIPLHMVSWVHLSHLTQGIQRSSTETHLGWTFPTDEFQIFPSKQKLFVFFASIHYWNQGLNESVKLWTWILLPSLTLQIRQCCWKSVPCPACTKKTYNSNKEGEKAPGQGPWEPAGVEPFCTTKIHHCQCNCFLSPKNSPAYQCFSSGYRYTFTQGKNQIPPLSCLSPLLRLPRIMCYLVSAEPGQHTKDTQSHQQTQDKIH